MAHTYVSDLVHCVFSTKLRRNLIKVEFQSDLWSFLGGIAQKQIQGAQSWRHRKSRAHLVVVACGYGVGEGDAIDQRCIVAMDERNAYPEFRVAGGIWGIYGWYLANGGHDCVYRVAGGTPLQA